MDELDYEESWAQTNWCFWTVVLEKTLESPLDCKEIKSVNPKGNQSWIFIEGLMLKLKLWYFGRLMWKLTPWKTPWCWEDCRQEEKGMADDEMVGWHHQLDGHKFERTPGVGDGQGGLACCSLWGCRVGHNWATELNWIIISWHIYRGRSKHRLSSQTPWVSVPVVLFTVCVISGKVTYFCGSVSSFVKWGV